MSEIQVGDWVWLYDSTNNQSILRETNTGNQIELKDNGDVVLRNGDLDLNRNDIVNVATLNGADIANASDSDVLQSDGNGGLKIDSSVSLGSLNGLDLTTAISGEILQSDGQGNIVADKDIEVDSLNGANFQNASTNEIVQSDGNGGLTLDRSIDVQSMSVQGGDFQTEHFTPFGSGLTGVNDASVFFLTELQDGETFSVTQATFVQPDGSAVIDNVDLSIADVTSDSSVSTILAGNGTSVYNHEVGSPLASYTNQSGSPSQVALIVDNGNYNTGNSAQASTLSSAICRIS